MRISLSLLFAVIFTFSSFGQKKLSLDQAINIALQRNTTLQRNLNNIKVAESNVKAAYGNFLPSLSAGGSWGWNRSEDEGSTYNLGSVVITTPPSVTESRSYRVSADARWTLFDGLANFASLSQSKKDLESARLQIERLKQEIVFQTVNLYTAVSNAQQLLKVSQEDLKWNNQQLETVTERNKLGAVTLADVYQQQVKTGNAELALINAQNALETAKSNLLYYLGLDVLEDYQFSDTLDEKDLDILKTKFKADYSDLSDLVGQALKTRLDYKSAKIDIESAESGITVARSGHLPSISNSYSFSTYTNKFDKLFKSKSYSIGLSLNVPIFSGFSVENRVEAAEVNAQNKQIALVELERDIKRNLQKTLLDLKAAEKQLDVNERNVAAAEETRKIEQEKYNLGSGTLLNVLIANSDYTTAKTNYINSQFNYIKLREQLKFYLGSLNFKKFE